MQDKPREPGVEYPRGEIEILAPGEQPRAPQQNGFRFDRAPGGRGFAIQGRSGGFLALVLVGLLTVALFTFLAGALVLVAGVAAVGFVAYTLRNQLQRLLGR